MNRMDVENVKPNDIEKRSFEIITELLGDRKLDEDKDFLIKRVIHTTADFDYVDNLYFSEDVMDKLMKVISEGCYIVTDTKMAFSGINKPALAKTGSEAFCFISDEDVAKKAKEEGLTRSALSMKKASTLDRPVIFAIGNAPTALLEIRDMYDSGSFTPAGVIGVPVGFVNVEVSKEKIIETDIPCIVARGRKGGSNVAAAIVNALLYKVTNRQL